MPFDIGYLLSYVNLLFVATLVDHFSVVIFGALSNILWSCTFFFGLVLVFEGFVLMFGGFVLVFWGFV